MAARSEWLYRATSAASLRTDLRRLDLERITANLRTANGSSSEIWQTVLVTSFPWIACGDRLSLDKCRLVLPEQQVSR